MDNTSATTDKIMEVTPALPKYMLPAPSWEKEFHTTYAKIPIETAAIAKPAIPRFDWVFSVNL